MTEIFPYDSAEDWFAAKIQGATDLQELRELINPLIEFIPHEDLVDTFKKELTDAGYYRKAALKGAEDRVSRLSRERVVELLDSVSIQSYDHESTGTLREALWQSVLDGDIEPEDVEEND